MLLAKPVRAVLWYPIFDFHFETEELNSLIFTGTISQILGPKEEVISET